MKMPHQISPYDSQAITQVMAEAVEEAIEVHRRLKEPVVVARDGKIVWLKPQDIAPRPLPGDDEPLPEDIEI